MIKLRVTYALKLIELCILIDEYAHDSTQGTLEQKSKVPDLRDKDDFNIFYHCVHHPEEKITLFCNTHKENACDLCRSREHDQCEMEELSDLSKDIVSAKDAEKKSDSMSSHDCQPFPRPTGKRMSTERTAGNMVCNTIIRYGTI